MSELTQDINNDKKIVYIEVGRIIPHPKNLRADLGDLYELTKSIKNNGILQNLTVVTTTIEEEVPAAHGRTETERKNAYMLVIGHRRHAAAKIAGLKHLPCVISEMSETEQIATMLAENAQRNDLSVQEKAQGVQLMLDLGETIGNIAQKTGFTRATIKKYTNILALDDEKFKAAEMRGGSLDDYAKLEEIQNLELKNKVLEHIGTSNFNFKLNEAVQAEKNKLKKQNFIEWFKSFATEITTNEIPKNIQHEKDFWLFSEKEQILPSEIESRKYFFRDQGHLIVLYKELSDEELEQSNSGELEKQQQEQQRKERIGNLKSLTSTAYSLRRQFIKDFQPKKEHHDIIMKFAAEMLFLGEAQWSLEEHIIEIFELEAGSKVEKFRIAREYIEKLKPEKNLLICTYCCADAGEWVSFNWHSGLYEESEELDRVYRFLESLGYEISDEERALMDGTHELFA